MSLRLAASIAIVCACLVGTVIASAVLYGNAKNAADDASRDIGARASTRIADIVSTTSQGLRGAGALFDASENVEPDEFAAYTRHLIADRAVTTIAFLEAVDHDERAAWEARNGVDITAIGANGPSPRRERYFPTTLIASEATDPTFGVDLASNQIRRDAIERAVDTGSPWLTPPIDLISDTRGLVMFLPVYSEGAAPSSVTERREELEGVVLGVYRAGTLGSSIGRGLDDGRSVAIFDGDALVTTVGPEQAEGRTITNRVDVAGRSWEIRTGPTPRPELWPSIVAAISGVIVTAAIIALLGALARRERRARAEAQQSTRDAQEAIKARGESEERYSTLVATMADGVLVQDADGRVITCNAAAERMLGLTEDQLRDPTQMRIGLRMVDELGEPVERDDQPPFRALATGSSQPGRVFGLARDDGLTTWVSFTSEPLRDDAGDAPRGVVSCFSDISEQISASEKIRQDRDRRAALIDAMQDGIIQTDADLAITEVNPRFCEMTGFTTDELIGRTPPYPFWPSEESDFTDLTPDLSDGRARETDTTYVHADGRPLPVIVAAAPMRDESGAIVGAIRSVKDVTERLRVEQVKDEFVSVVSHELRTPLTSIHGALGVLAEGQGELLDDTGRHLLDIANRNTERLTHLINHVLDLEQIEAGRGGREPTPVRVDALIRQAADLLSPLAAEHSVSFAVTPVVGDPVVLCDPDRIAQVLTNFLSNAIKFSPGGSTVTLGAERIGDEVRFHVRDTGRGIPQDQLEKIFERFHQVDSSDRRRADGAGLGLAISAQIATLHGGRVWAESTVGVGSTFILALPADSADELPDTHGEVDAEGRTTPQAVL